MNNTISKTNFNFKGQQSVYHGKVRDVYTMENDYLVVVASDRISAFDVILPRAIPFKGQVLNQIATKFLKATKDIVPNWLITSPHSNVSIGLKCEAIPIEMVIRGYLAGHAWRVYKSGVRVICGVELPDGLHENDLLPEPIITPSTKAKEGHDEDISREEILKNQLVSEADYLQLEKYTRALFAKGTAIAKENGLILVDTKYEFGKKEGNIHLIDEVHTPDSSRYFYAEGYEERQQNKTPQKQLSKEFVREWLIDNGFQGKEGQAVPNMTDEFINSVSNRYIELYEKLINKPFEPNTNQNILSEIEISVNNFLQEITVK